MKHLLNLKSSNPAQHIGGILWLQGSVKGYSQASICGLMKISIMELGLSDSGQPSTNNTTYAKDNNAFGMLHPSKRKTTSTGSRELSGGYKSAVYKSVWDSVADVFLWLEYNKIPDSVKKAENCDAIIDFCQSNKWMTDMSNYKKISTTKADGFVKGGRNAFFVRLVAFTSITIILVGLLLKKNRVKYRAYYNKLGGFGKLLLTKPATARRVARRAVRTRVTRARNYVRRKAKK